MDQDHNVTEAVVDPPSWAAVDRFENKKYFPALDGLRGLAILLVVTYHAFNPYYENSAQEGGKVLEALTLIPHLGWIGVPIFFCLSGFLLSMPFWEAREKQGHWLPRHYVAKRVIRIVPSFYFSIILFVLADGFRLGNWNQYLHIALNWMTGVGLYSPSSIYFNPVYWSLIVEVQFYILLPLLFFGLFRFRPSTAVTVLIAFLLVGSFFCRFVVVHCTPPCSLDSFTEEGLKRYGGYFDLFVCGIVFAYLYYYKKGLEAIQRIPYWAILCFLLIASIICRPLLRSTPGNEAFSWLAYELRHYFVSFASFLLIIVQLYESSWVYSFFSTRWMVYFGAISYEWYLLHDPILEQQFGIAQWFHLGLTGRLCCATVLLLLSLLLSMIVHHIFYLPVSAYLKSKFIRKDRLSALASAA